MLHASTLPAATPERPSLSARLVQALEAQGVRLGFGVMGGALVPLHAELRQSQMSLVHCRHETGAVYAALEASLAGRMPTLAFATTGPGLTNAITGAVAARQEGAHVLLISGYTAPAQHGRRGLQETHGGTLLPSLYNAGPIFDAAWALTDPRALDSVLLRLERGWKRPQGFLAHLAIPLDTQRASVAPAPPQGNAKSTAPVMDHAPDAPAPGTALWLGYGARHAAPEIRSLAERAHLPVLCTPRAKGIFPERHPLFLGVSGSIGGDPALPERIRAQGLTQALVLGTRLGEFSATESVLAHFERLIHVDLDPEVPGAAWPRTPTQGVTCEIGAFVSALNQRALRPQTLPLLERRSLRPLQARVSERVRPQVLMSALQRQVVDGSEALVMAESGNAFAWTTRHLRFSEPGRYRQAGAFAPMGQVAAGAVGAALATGRPVVAVVGDGAFLMQSEISTAAATQAPVIWVVLNDARYGMVEQGLAALGQADADQRFPEVDFAAIAHASGVHGERIHCETRLDQALARALQRPGPSILDLRIDPEQRAPLSARVQSIRTQSSLSPIGA